MKDYGKKSAYRRLDKKKIGTCKDYQRGQSKRAVMRIAENFQWRKFGTLQVSERPDGTNWILDGGHRLAAAMMLPAVSALPCMVTPVSGVAEEAEIFFDMNDKRRKLRPFEQWEALLAALDTEAVATMAAAKEWGYNIGWKRGDNGTPPIMCPSRLMKLNRVNRLRPVLQFISEGFPHSPERTSETFLKAANQFMGLLSRNEIDPLSSDVMAKMKRVSAGGILSRADTRRAMQPGGMTQYKAALYELLDAYNHGRRSGKIGPS